MSAHIDGVFGLGGGGGRVRVLRGHRHAVDGQTQAVLLLLGHQGAPAAVAHGHAAPAARRDPARAVVDAEHHLRRDESVRDGRRAAESAEI